MCIYMCINCGGLEFTALQELQYDIYQNSGERSYPTLHRKVKLYESEVSRL